VVRVRRADEDVVVEGDPDPAKLIEAIAEEGCDAPPRVDGPDRLSRPARPSQWRYRAMSEELILAVDETTCSAMRRIERVQGKQPGVSEAEVAANLVDNRPRLTRIKGRRRRILHNEPELRNLLQIRLTLPKES